MVLSVSFSKRELVLRTRSTVRAQLCTVIVLHQQLALCHHTQSATRNHAAKSKRNLSEFCVSEPDTASTKNKRPKIQRTEVRGKGIYLFTHDLQKMV